MKKHKEHIESVARNILVKQYGNRYASLEKRNPPDPDFMGVLSDGTILGLEVCEITSTPMTMLLSKSTKITDVKPTKELIKGEMTIPMIVGKSNSNGEIKSFAYTGKADNLGLEIFNNAIATLRKHLKNLQSYTKCDIYELGMVLPVGIVGDLFEQYATAISNCFQYEIETDNVRYFHNIHIISGIGQGKSYRIEPK